MCFLNNPLPTFVNIEFIQLVKVFFCVDSRCTGEKKKKKEKIVNEKKYLVLFLFLKKINGIHFKPKVHSSRC